MSDDLEVAEVQDGATIAAPPGPGWPECIFCHVKLTLSSDREDGDITQALCGCGVWTISTIRDGLVVDIRVVHPWNIIGHGMTIAEAVGRVVL